MKLPTDYQTFIHLSRYSRWLEEDNRRETWEETISRLVNYFKYHIENNLEIFFKEEDSDIWKELYRSISSLEVMPSMRAMMAAGPALARENIAGYNCSYIPIDSPRSFDEVLYILMNGTGVGFSVERQYVNNLPTIPYTDMEETDDVISVADSKEGWARAFKDLISYLYSGRIPQINMDKVRPAGSRLNVFGGRASGPEPLHDLFKFTIKKFQEARGRKLTSLECHDIVSKTGEVVAKTTGQEDHMVNEDGSLTVINSEQNESIHDAFKDVDVEMVLQALERNPQKKNVRELLSALNKVFRQKQFQS